MAAIGKIRERSTLLLIVIGVAMVAFILGEYVAGQGNSPASQYVGEVYGEEINMLDYEQRVENEVQAMNSIGNPISTTDPQVRNQVWDDMIQEMIMYKELNELGVRMSREEYDDIRFGENANPEFRSGEMFKNPETGTFDPMAVQNYFALMESDFPVYHQVEQRRLMNGRLYEKYNNMIKLGIAVNTLDAKDQYYRQEQKADFTYVVRTFASIADSTIEVSEKELKAYYDKHKHEDRFEQDPEVDLEYVVFTVEASEEDKEYTREELSNLKEEFANASNDSSFAVRHSDSRRAMLKTLEAGGDDELQAMIDSAQIGDVIGPYELDGIMAIAKVVETDVKELATARHILLSKDNTPDIDVLNSRADSIVRVIKRDDNFEEMVTLFSDDPGSIANGGVYENFDRTRMVPEFTEASFDRPIGSLNVVETSYGVHIVEPLEVTEEKVLKVWEVDFEIRPTSETFNRVYDEANEFSLSIDNVADFSAEAESRGYEVREGSKIGPMAMNLPNVPSSQDVIRWAHAKESTKVGSISEPMEFGNNIVVTALKARREQGRASFEDSKDMIRPDVIREKKAEMFKKEMQGKSIAELESEFNLSVKMATNVSQDRPNLPGAGNEPYIVGFAMTMTEGTVSEPLTGRAGVYVIQLESKTDVQPREEYLVYRDELEYRIQSRMQSPSTGVYRALKDVANIKDERSQMFQRFR